MHFTRSRSPGVRVRVCIYTFKSNESESERIERIESETDGKRQRETMGEKYDFFREKSRYAGKHTAGRLDRKRASEKKEQGIKNGLTTHSFSSNTNDITNNTDSAARLPGFYI